MYIDGVTSTPLSDGSKMTLYADGMLLYRHIETPQGYQKLQNGINSIVEWISVNHLHFKVSKCKSMLISRKRNPLQHPMLSLGDQVLEQVECFNIFRYATHL